jgi:alanyl-tRNA synthetase
MQAQKDSSKAGSNFTSNLPTPADVDATTFQGYEFLDSESKVLSIWNGQDLVDTANENDEVFIALNQTSFYAESGGQVGDTGTFDSNSCSGVVLDCKKQGKVFLHKAKIKTGSLKCGDVINMSVEKDKRRATAIHHSATHLLHAALKKVLGDHVQQKGSQVDHLKLRFDFAHSAPLTANEISEIEMLVNNQSLLNTKVSTKEMELNDAIDSGAEALFGEKYDDKVRVLDMGKESFSVELCGGTHVDRTGDIGTLVITSQSSVASGVRRIEAIAGRESLEYLANLKTLTNELQKTLNTSSDKLSEKVNALVQENKKLKKSGPVKSNQEVISSEELSVDGWTLVIEQLKLDDNKELRGLVDQKKAKLSKGCVILLSEANEKVAVVAGVTQNLVDIISAKDIVSELCLQLDGRGGGRPDFAQGAGNSKNINDFVTSIPKTVKSLSN